MAEYIERDKLVEFLRQVRRDLPHDSKDFFTRDEMILNFQQFVESKSFVPSEDVEPVRRGRWVWEANYRDYDGDIYSVYSCSVCGVKNDETTNYCKNCGAKMKGEENGRY